MISRDASERLFCGYSGPDGREWHTDWPHDLSDRGGQAQGGPIRQPFPDVCMCLSMVWYMIDADSSSGGTFCLPGSHRDTRNPRGPYDGITVTAPIPDELQIHAPAGSVFIQDSRMWHSTACSNTCGKVLRLQSKCHRLGELFIETAEIMENSS